MRRNGFIVVAVCGLMAASAAWLSPRTAAAGQGQQEQASEELDPVQELVGRLSLEGYKATLKGLTQFGDRRQGTDRNRKAVDWIEAKLQSYGCQTERIQYEYNPAPRRRRGGAGGGRGRRAPREPVIASGEVRNGPGGSRYRGTTRQTGVNSDPEAQPDDALRELNREPTSPGLREEVYCTKVGSTRPDEMYIIGAHMDGHGWG